MSDVASRDLRNETASLIRRAQAGEDITVTVHGKPAAILTAYKQSRGQWVRRDEVLERLRRIRAAAGRSTTWQQDCQTGVPLAANGLLHTSVFHAIDQEHPLDFTRLPDHLATTVVTTAELNSAVLQPGSMTQRAQRLAALDAVADMVALPADHHAALEWAKLRGHLDHTEQSMSSNDMWTAAIATAHMIPVVVGSDAFDPLVSEHGLTVGYGLTVIKVRP